MAQASGNPQRQVYYPQRTLQTLALSSYERQHPVGFFSLPGEIRNIIMELALVPGEIQLHATETYKPPGFHFLATCKQACAEGYALFFSKNIFYLPWGPVENIRNCFKEIHAEHRSTIQSVCLMLGLQDLTLTGFEEVETEMNVIFGSGLLDKPGATSRGQGRAWGSHVETKLKKTWDRKLKWLRAHAMGMRLVRIGNAGEAYEFEGWELEYVLTRRRRQDGTKQWLDEAHFLTQDAGQFVREDVVRVVNRDGWKVFKVMVERGEFRTRK